MIPVGKKVYVYGRIRGLTAAAVARLAGSAELQLVRKAALADLIVLARSSAPLAVADSGELRLPFAVGGHGLLSEGAFRALIGAQTPKPGVERTLSAEQVARLSELTIEQVRTLSLYDVLSAETAAYTLKDVVIARAVARLAKAGAKFARLIWAANALEDRGRSLSEVRLAEAPWGAIVQVLGGALAEIDGQLLLPLDEAAVDAQEIFLRAETCEASGRLEEARRWYELAQRLDREDAAIPFNLGNVLADLERPSDAELAYRRALARDPDLADGWYNLGVVLEKTDRIEDALAAYEKAFAIEPTYADALHNAAALLMRTQKFARALPILERLAVLSPASSEVRRLAQLCRLELRRKPERA